MLNWPPKLAVFTREKICRRKPDWSNQFMPQSLESFVNVGRVGWCKLHGWQRVALLKISYFGADSNKF